MLTERDLALLNAKSVRDLRMEIKSLEDERRNCVNLYRRRWIDTRIGYIQDIVKQKLTV